MPKQTAPIGRAAERAARVARELGYTVVDTELAKEPTGRFLRVYIDKPDGVTIDDCEAFHRRIQPMMDDIDYDYMEVSSPGADRPLKKPEDFARAAGTGVEVRTYKPLNGQKVFLGDLVGLREETVVIRDANGEEQTFPLKQVALVKPVLVFSEEDLRDDIAVDDEFGGEDA